MTEILASLEGKAFYLLQLNSLASARAHFRNLHALLNTQCMNSTE